MGENNVTQEVVIAISEEQERLYNEELENVLKNKKDFLNRPKQYEKEIFSLERIIKINKYSGNNYAVIRDEVLVKSYKLIRAQNEMMKNVMRIIDTSDIDKFQEKMNELFVQNQLDNKKINDEDYRNILEIKDDSKVLMQAQNNIKDYYAILDINADILRYISIFEKKMYRLNKYSKYNLITPVIYINNFSFAKTLNDILAPYNLSIIKTILIVVLASFFYFIRKLVYFAIERALVEIKFLQSYSSKIVSKVYKLIEIIIVLIGLEMIIYIYNDFSSISNVDKLFNMSYYIIFTFIVYQVLNVVVGMKIHNIDLQNKHIKHEMINISLKIVNFLIFLVGLLIILSYVGVDLTAILSGLGIGGLAVALAARESLSNFFGTISILLSDVFSQGDWIAVENDEGVVIEIGLRVTTLRTFDNALIAIPNGLLANQDVKNWSKRILGRRIKMSLGIKYNSQSSDIKNAVNEIREMLHNHPDIATEKTSYEYDSAKSTKLVSQDDEQGVKRTLLVHLDEFSSSSINILVYCFTKSTDWEQWLQAKEDVMHKIMIIFEKNSLEFAFPSMSIYNENGTIENE